MKIIAHRGVHSESISENSKEAIEAVLESKADGIEIDVRITSDDVCVVNHDTHLGNGVRVSSMSFDQLSKHESKLMKATEALSVLSSFNGLINLEVKHLLGERGASRGRACVEQLSKDIEQMAGQIKNNIVISSFSMPNVRHSTLHMPSLNRAYLGPRTLSFRRILDRALKYECSAIHLSVPQMRSRRFQSFIDQIHNNGLEVRIFTVNSESEFIMAQSCGVDAIFTDHVDAMVSLRK